MFYYDRVNKDNRELTQCCFSSNIFISNKTLKVYPQPPANSNCPLNETSKVQNNQMQQSTLNEVHFLLFFGFLISKLNSLEKNMTIAQSKEETEYLMTLNAWPCEWLALIARYSIFVTI